MKQRTVLLLAALAALCGLLAAHHWILKALPENRVELLTGAEREIISAPDPFTAAQWKELAPEAYILDYSWAYEVLAASGDLWRFPAALCSLYVLLFVLLRQGKLELSRYRAAMASVYPGTYWKETKNRLLRRGLVAAAMLFAGLLLTRWLINAPIVLPPTLLPQGSLFDRKHYLRWLAETFPDGRCSDYALSLKRQWTSSLTCAALESTLLFLLTATAAGMIHARQKS